MLNKSQYNKQRKEPATIRVNYRFPESIGNRLSQAMEVTGLKESEIVRRAIDAHLKQIGI